MPSSRRARVDEVGTKGREDTKSAANPDRATPDSLGRFQAEATKQFEQPVSFDAIRSNKSGTSLHAGAPDGSGPPGDFSGQKAARGHKEVNPTTVKGHGVPKRGPGTRSQASDIDRLKTAGS